MPKKAKINGCISCGTCVSICPEIFDFNDENLAVNVLGEDAELPEDLESSIEEAAAACPVNAIILE